MAHLMGEPLGILHICLAVGKILDITGVDQYHRDAHLVEQISIHAYIATCVTYALAEELTDLAWKQETSVQVGALSEHKRAAAYRVQDFPGELKGRPYRFIVRTPRTGMVRKEKVFHPVPHLLQPRMPNAHPFAPNVGESCSCEKKSS